MNPRKLAGYGWRPDTPDQRDRIYNLEEQIDRAPALPPSVSMRPDMPAVYDQGQLGSCTGNGIAGVLEHEAMRQGEPAVTPSRLFIYYEERVIEGTVASDAGAEIRDGIKVVAGEGAPPETDWPYDITQFAVRPPDQAYADAKQHAAIQYQRVIPGQGYGGAPIRTALSRAQPIVFGFTVPSYFEDGTWDPATSALHTPPADDQPIGGHCVVAVGYDFTRQRFPVNVLEIRNSWGAGWGDQGYFWMDAAWFSPHAELVSDLWVISRVM